MEALNFELPKNESSYIKVIGVGGGGGNAVKNMYREGITGVDYIICNTDAQALANNPVPVKIQIGAGLGAGNNPEVACDAIQAKREEIKRLLENNTRMLFIAAGMGGGTGTGAAPVIAEIAKEIELDDEIKKILVVAIVTTPFSFEGRKRKEQAADGLKNLRKNVDAIIVLNNDKLHEYNDKLDLKSGFALMDKVICTAAKGISEIITKDSDINVDFKDVNTVMKDSGVALMGYGIAAGEDRARTAIEEALNAPLLNDNNISGAKNILFHVSFSTKNPMKISELYTITSVITEHTGVDSTDIIWGSGEDESLDDNIVITLIATGFNEKAIDKGRKVVNIGTLDLGSGSGRGSVSGAFGASGVSTANKPAPVVVELDITATPSAIVAPAVAAVDAMSTTVSVVVEEPAVEPIAEAVVEPVAETFAETIAETVPAPVAQPTPTVSVLQLEEQEFATPEPVKSATPRSLFAPEEKPAATVDSNISTKVANIDIPTKIENSHIPTRGINNTSSQTSSSESTIKALNDTVVERMRRMAAFKQKSQSPEGLREIEEVPAHVRNGKNLEFETQYSTVSVARKITDNGTTITENNFFNPNVD